MKKTTKWDGGNKMGDIRDRGEGARRWRKNPPLFHLAREGWSPPWKLQGLEGRENNPQVTETRPL